ncbi:MFS transporter [Aureimonas sp. OT7]|uniref:MFS transporter n=1 Tax=Aureimonas TaxID=414371 RepID=UPI0017863B06|nr:MULTISPECIES: MFS transporter [Aureimonas]QOG07217.1 MFS transporter [Aureimonas sp. OT7]
MTLSANAPIAGWADLLSGGNLVRSLALSGGVALHAINLYISTTILPSVIQEIGGREYYAWNTTLFVVASILGAALTTPLLASAGPRPSYGLATLVFVVGTLVCGTSSTMAAMLTGRVVQGFGGGALLALAYAMVSRVYPERLWSRALALLSSMWGIATLLGPAIGGVFAQFDLWRGAFLVLVPFAGLNVLAALVVLPQGRREGSSASPLPVVQLALLTVAVVAASWGGIGRSAAATTIAMLVATALVAGLIMVERRSVIRLFPASTFRYPATLGSLYASSALLAVTVTCTEIFLPLFLQELHGRSPLEAGYIAAVMSAGWTAAAIVASGLGSRRQDRAMRAGPLLSLCAMLTLAGILPWAGGPTAWLPLASICGALVAGGVGVGLAYPALAARVLHAAPPEEADSAASSIMTVQLCATAFGSALAGLVVNLAGGSAASDTMDLANAARWLFVTVAMAPAICLVVMGSRSFRLAAERGAD